MRWAWVGMIAATVACKGDIASGSQCDAVGGTCASSKVTCHNDLCEPACATQAPSSAQDCSGNMVCCLSLTDAGASPTDGSVTDSSLPTDGPAPDSSQCDRTDGVCVLCSDQRWHCGSTSWPPCPSGPYPTGVRADADCVGYELGGNDCFTCGSDGGGDDWTCIGSMPGEGSWRLTSHPCSP